MEGSDDLVITARSIAERIDEYIRGEYVDTEAGELTASIYALGQDPDLMSLPQEEINRAKENARARLNLLVNQGLLEVLPDRKRCPTSGKFAKVYRIPL